MFIVLMDIWANVEYAEKSQSSYWSFTQRRSMPAIKWAILLLPRFNVLDRLL
jgi:hypothetical protein